MDCPSVEFIHRKTGKLYHAVGIVRHKCKFLWWSRWEKSVVYLNAERTAIYSRSLKDFFTNFKELD